MYRMALDQIPNTSKDLRLKIMRNIGNAFVRTENYPSAITSFEAVMEGKPNHQTGFNLLVCYYALGDTELMRKGFQQLLQVEVPPGRDEDDDGKDDGDTGAEGVRDVLKEELLGRRKAALRYVTIAAKLIAPVVDKDWVKGYDWVVEALRADFDLIASELQISKAINFLKEKQFDMVRNFHRPSSPPPSPAPPLRCSRARV